MVVIEDSEKSGTIDIIDTGHLFPDDLDIYNIYDYLY